MKVFHSNPHLFQLADPEMPPLNKNSFSVSSLPLVPQHLVSTRMSEPFIVVIRRAATPEALCRVVKVALGIEMVSEPSDQAVQLVPHLGSQSCSTRDKELLIALCNC